MERSEWRCMGMFGDCDEENRNLDEGWSERGRGGVRKEKEEEKEKKRL